jgi:hypothetical protein
MVYALIRISWSQLIEGVALGILLALLYFTLLTDVPVTTVLGGYVIIVFFVSSALASSPTSGLILALSVLIGEIPTEFFYLCSTYGAVDVSILPYAVGIILFVARIPLFPVAGAFGGYVGREYFAEKARPVRRRRKVVKRKTGETPANRAERVSS